MGSQTSWQPMGDARAWDNALSQCKTPHVLQSWAWGEFKSRWGWSAQRWVLRAAPDDTRVLAAVQLLRRKAGPFCALYAPKGPVLAADAEPAIYAEVLAFLEGQARKAGAIWLKVDGDMPFGLDEITSGSDGNQNTLTQWRSTLRQRKWRYSPSQVQFRNTGLNLIHQTDDALLAGMKQKWRYNVRLAEKRGVVVRAATRADDDLLYALYAETAQRDGFLIREKAYYVDAWRAMNAQGFVAEHDGQVLAGLVLFTFAQRAWYFYGMSRTEGREHMPSYALQWQAMRWARDHGCHVYDWWGAPEKADDEADSMAGVWRFKQGFGAQFFEGLGAWDYAPSALLYKGYVELMPRVMRWLRRRNGQAMPVAQ